MNNNPPKTISIAVLAACLVLACRTEAATVTWDADTSTTGAQDGAGSWSTSANNWWNGSSDNVWNNGDSAIFGTGTGPAGAVGISTTGITVSNVTFNPAGTGNYTINSGNLSTLTLVGNPTITAVSDATLGLVLAGTGFTKEGSGVLTLNAGANNNTFTGTTIINNGRLVLGNGTDNIIQLSSPSVIVNSGGALLFSTAGPLPGAGTLTINGGAVTNSNPTGAKLLTLSRLTLDGNGILAASVSGATLLVTNYDVHSGTMLTPRLQNNAANNFPLIKSTSGTATIDTGSQSAGAQGFIVTMNGGTLIMEYLNPGPNGDSAIRGKYGAGPLTLAGGTLRNQFPAGSGGRTENGITGTTIRPGATSLIISNANTSGGFTLGMAGLTRNAGGTVDFSRVTAGGGASFTTTTANVNGILGGWATFSGTDWALGSPVASAAAIYLTSTDPAQWTATTNVSLSANPLANLNDTTIYSLRLTNGPTVTINPSKTLTLASGGLLVVGSSATTITGGALQGAAASDLIIQQYSSADLSINSDLADNSGCSLTKSGSGKVILTGNSSLSGSNFINAGVVEVGDLAKLASGPLVMSGGALRYTGLDVSDSRAVLLSGAGSSFDVSNSATKLTQSGVITGSGAAIGDLGGLVKNGSGTLALTASNYYNGTTVVSNGTLLVNGTNAFNPAVFGAGNITLYGGTLGGFGLIAGSVTAKANATISPGTSPGTLTLGGNLTLESGSTNYFEVTNSPGTGDLLVVQGNLNVSNSRIVISVLGSALQPGTNTLIQYSGTKSGSFNPAVILAGGAVNGSPVVDESTPGQINLVVKQEVVITTQPADAVVSTNDPVSFSVTATGTAPIRYQWYFYGNNTNGSPTALTDATNALFTIASAQGTNSGYYTVAVSNDYSSVTSRFASLFVGNLAPVVTGPTNKTVIAGNSVTFNASVFGNPVPVLQWQTNGVNVPGANSSSLTLANVPFALDGALVSLVASNVVGSVTNSATLTVIVTPAINPQPTNLVVNVGDAAAFMSGASGVPAPSLQWYKNGSPITDATNSTVNISSAQGSDIGGYSLVASNSAGSVTSSVATLTVYSTSFAVTAVSPTNGTNGVCLDTPLYLTFNGAVATVNAGRVRIYNAASPATPVDVIDVSTNQVVTNGVVGVYNVQPRTIGGAVYRTFPVLLLTSNSAAVYPHAGVLATNQTYYVTIDGGVFQDGSGAYFPGITNTSAWQFTAKATGLAAGSSNVVVAADGTGDFATVQGAADFLPAANSNHVTINIRNGTYREIVFLNAKNNVTFRGQDRHQTLISYVNNDPLNTGTSARPMFRVRGNDIAMENLTLTNATPKGGLQAEALRVGDGSKRFIGYNADFDSFQDTVLVNNTGDLAYFQDCHIQGDTDFIWGLGTIYITNCEVMAMSSQSHNTQARTDATTNGFAFVRCQLTRASAAVTNCDLGRDAGNGFSFSQVAYVACSMDSHIRPEGWIDGGLTVKTSLRFWEYQSTDLTGTNLVDVSNRAAWSQQIPFTTATNVQDVLSWLYGWVPQLAPNILSQPSGQSVSGGSPAVFAVSATGIPNPAFQWLKNGSAVPGATSATLTVSNAYAGDAATYSVIVSNAAGSVTSSNATLSVGNTAPTLSPIADRTVNVGVIINFTNTASDPDAPSQTLAFSLLSGPTNASVDTGSGVFTWRPLVTQANSTNPISIVVSDNGSPSLSATQSFLAIVNPLAKPSISSVALSGGQVALQVAGDAGPDYEVQASTNLTQWQSVFTTNSPATPFQWTDPNPAFLPMRFYRIVAGPPLP